MRDVTQIYYYVNGTRFAFRSSAHVPRVGDEIRFNGVCYAITRVVWIEDQARDSDNHVAIDLKRVDDHGEEGG